MEISGPTSRRRVPHERAGAMMLAMHALFGRSAFEM